MTKLIKPIFEQEEGQLFESTRHRFFNMFTPIQEYRYKDPRTQQVKVKHQDFMAYLANPFIDSFLDSAFALDAAIHLVNATASFAKALYTWSLNQQKTDKILDKDSEHEFNEAWTHLWHGFSMVLAQTFNALFSIIALVTRPIASVVHDMAEAPSHSYSMS